MTNRGVIELEAGSERCADESPIAGDRAVAETVARFAPIVGRMRLCASARFSRIGERRPLRRQPRPDSEAVRAGKVGWVARHYASAGICPVARRGASDSVGKAEGTRSPSARGL